MTKNNKKALIPSPEYKQFKIIENPLRMKKSRQIQLKIPINSSKKSLKTILLTSSRITTLVLKISKVSFSPIILY